jgi:hypothetical protein
MVQGNFIALSHSAYVVKLRYQDFDKEELQKNRPSADKVIEMVYLR